MKLKTNLGLSLLSLVCIPTIFVVSARVSNIVATSHSLADSPPSSAQDYYNYIYNRSFSIMAKDQSKTLRGTGWLFKHLDSAVNNFHYLMFTNWHVEHAMMLMSKPTFSFNQVAPQIAADISNNTPAVPSATEHQQASFNSYISFSGFHYVGVASYYTDSNNVTYGADAAIADVTFSPTFGSDLYKQLYVLNNVADENGALVQFHSGVLPRLTSLYCAGYPGANAKGERYSNSCVQWETSTSEIDETRKSWTTSFPPFSQYTHSIDEDDNDNIAMDDDYVTSKIPCTEGSPIGPMYYLGAGASGSMGLYYNGNNSKYEVAGLCWGMWHDSSMTWYQQATLIYNSPGHYDLYSDYIASKWIPIPGKMNSTIIIIISVVSATTLVGVGLIIAFTIKHKKCKKLNNNVKKTNGVKK